MGREWQNPDSKQRPSAGKAGKVSGKRGHRGGVLGLVIGYNLQNGSRFMDGCFSNFRKAKLLVKTDLST